MITASQARSMAETRWGRGGTHGYRTNTRGTFYYGCSSHGGYVIDGRCLTDAARISICQHLQMPQASATEILNIASQKVTQFRGPENYRTLRYNALTETHREVPIFFAEEDCDWAVIEFFTDIRVKGHENRDHRSVIETYYPEIRLCPTPTTTDR